jgi:microcystin-dependent protein
MDFLNKEKLTHIIIFIFILLSLTYLFNINSNITNPIKTKTITENFMILTEDQDLESNNVMINNLTQVSFKAGGNNNSTVNFPNPNMDWPVSLQDIFDSKLDNNGIIGKVVSGNTPLQGIILSDATGKTLVKIGDSIARAVPITATTITDSWIQFGGPNNNRDINSARISVELSGENTDALCIVGMSIQAGVVSSRKIKMWAEGGCTLTGPLTVTGTTTLSSSLTVTGATTLSSLTVTGATTLNSSLTVTGAGTIGGALTVTGKTNTPGGINSGSGLIETTDKVRAGGMQSGWIQVGSTLEVAGTANFSSSLTVSGALNFLPKGCIIMFHGTAAPIGWAICDGTQDTPDLRGRFVLGLGIAGPNNPNTYTGDSDGKDAGYVNENYTLNTKGGCVKQTLSEAQMPSHNHGFNDIYYSETWSPTGIRNWFGSGRSDGDNGPHSTWNTSSEMKGGGAAHTNMPPYYVLLYIMRL